MLDSVPYFPPERDSRCPFDPPPALVALQVECPVSLVSIWDGTPAWLFTRHAEVREVLNDERFSANPSHPGFPEKSAAYKATLGRDENLRTLDNPEHDRQKRMIMRDLTVRRVEAMRPSMQVKVDSLIDDMLKGTESELVGDFALAMPTMVLCELLGVDYADRDWFAERSVVMLSLTAPAEQAAAAGQELDAFLSDLIDMKIEQPADDLVTRLAVEQVATGALRRDQAVSTLRFLLVAGHETTANMISLSTLALLQNPEQKQILIDDPGPDTVTNAVEELLRYLSVSHAGRRRVAIADTEVAGQFIRAGQGVIAMNSLADRDPRVFDDPERLDLRRPNARVHLAFGYGMHHCVGQLLARVELQIVLATLWRRIPSLRLNVALEEVEFASDGAVYGLKRLPVTWDAQ